MIRQSFCFLQGIGHKKEHHLWQQGIHDWNTFLQTEKITGVSPTTKQEHDAFIDVCKKKLWDNDAAWFANVFTTKDHWRLYDHFKEDAVYLDIETDGYYGSITVLGLYDGYQTMTFVRGINLNKKLIEQQLSKYKMIVTFNGASFDLPIIKRYFNIAHAVPHVDLRFVCQRAGFIGGLKSIERELGIKRAADLDGVTGIDAVALWHAFRQTGERAHLDRLVQYNEEDIINLPIIAQKIIPQLWEKIRH